MRGWPRPSTWSAPSVTPEGDCHSRTRTRAKWSTHASAISSSTWTSAKAGPAAGTPCARCVCFAGPIVTVRDVWNVARSARSGRLRVLIASDVSVKVAGQSGLKVPDVETGRLLRDDRGWAPVGGLEDGGLTQLFDGIVFASLARRTPTAAPTLGQL